MRHPLLLALLVAFFVCPAAFAEKLWVFVGTYTGKKSQGIYRVEFDTETGKLGKPEVAAETASPSFLAIAPDRKHLFCVGEVDSVGGKKGGGVSSFALDAKTGELKAINQQSSVGAGPCHIVSDKQGKNVIVANYGGGSVAVLPVDSDGKLGEASCFVQHKGTSVDKSRQEAPHAHSANLDAANKFAVVADLGLDKLLVYKFDPEAGKLTPNDPPAAELPAGSGPRHFAFHPNGKFAYLNCEMASSLTALSYDAAKGTFKILNSLPTIPAPDKKNSTAESVVHPNGKFVYTSNRGHNSIAIFAIDEKTGEITAKGNQGEGINIPRNFNIDPTGKWMIVANQDGDSIVVFEIDGQTGQLKPTDQKVMVGSPVCVKFVKQD
jgi:6-phosphogluconolactonase